MQRYRYIQKCKQLPKLSSAEMSRRFRNDINRNNLEKYHYLAIQNLADHLLWFK